MILTTERLTLRPLLESDAKSMFRYAKDPDVGPIAGWPPHQDEDESLRVIRALQRHGECYAICEKGSDGLIGLIELKLGENTDMTERDDECELGYWLGKPFWGRGYMPEAVCALLDYAFDSLGMQTVWCGYYEGNAKSKRVQEKVGFIYHHSYPEVPVPLMGEIRLGHTNEMTKVHWLEISGR